ncbi:MAG: hypothetical protein BGO68_00385 [Candidatus Amoebophilus sp. 36-38]|nr:MAG: hypothetical protein BGO68_00385 [Candidatus Amoebophilus sp. 36-38]
MVIERNYKYDSLWNRLIVYVILSVGLFLQGCSGNEGLLGGHYERSGVNNWKLQNGDDYKEEKQGMHGKKKRGQARKRKRIKNQKNEKGNLNGVKHRRLENTEKPTQEIKKEKKRKKSKNKKEQGAIRAAKEGKKKEKVKTIQPVNGRCVNKRKKLGDTTEINDKKFLVDSSKQTKKRKKAEIGLLDLPEGILQDIISYLSFESRMSIMRVNHFFYTISTGYKQVGMIGIANKPDYNPDPKTSTWSISKVCGTNRIVNFRRLTDSPKLACTRVTIPSFAFYVLMRRVDNLPRAYRPYLRDSQIRQLSLGCNKLSHAEVVELSKNLQGKVDRICLMLNDLRAIDGKGFGENLPADTNLREIDLSFNKLKAVGADGFTKHVPRTAREIHLGSNKIGDEGAIAVATNLRDKEVEEVWLEDNNIGDEGLRGILENLQHTSVKKLILGVNKITDIGAKQAASYILGTNLEDLYLGGNKITHEGAIAIVKGCIGSKVKRLSLSFNRGITNKGILEIAKNLKGTAIEEIELRQYKDKIIRSKTQQQARKECPHIKWIFEHERV